MGSVATPGRLSFRRREAAAAGARRQLRGRGAGPAGPPARPAARPRWQQSPALGGRREGGREGGRRWVTRAPRLRRPRRGRTGPREPGGASALARGPGGPGPGLAGAGGPLSRRGENGARGSPGRRPRLPAGARWAGPAAGERFPAGAALPQASPLGARCLPAPGAGLGLERRAEGATCCPRRVMFLSDPHPPTPAMLQRRSAASGFQPAGQRTLLGLSRGENLFCVVLR